MTVTPIELEVRRVGAHDASQVSLANFGHEIKTPASALCVLAEALVRESAGTEQARIAERIRIEANRLCTTVNELIEGRTAEPVENNGKALIRSVTERLALKADMEKVDLVVQGDDEVQLFGNPVEIVSALHHLVENAIKHSSGGSRVEVQVRQNGDYGEIDVSDGGRGIDPQYHEAVFQRHFRMDADKEKDGSGIGLDIVRQAAANNSGEVILRSTPGQGSTFTLRIPKGASHV